ncbi:hypothetical protein AVEN_131223-1 [Araneus ventricosus]|uniref:Uncharacterized protein n=1 Tax=Araneus ventricosus TaxID=182803 RepID=A0A4Y2IRV4_ARAVE|nr:hypothetical protein AVEN_131223-1 [Araneus ventricosus]
MRRPPILPGYDPSSEMGPKDTPPLLYPPREREPAYLSGNFSSVNLAGGDETQGPSQNKRWTIRKVSCWSTRVRLSSEGKDRRGFTTPSFLSFYSPPEGVNKN